MDDLVVVETEALKTEIMGLLGNVNLVGLRRIKAGIEKKIHRLPQLSGCKPRLEPLTGWKPKHEALSRAALRLIQNGTGLKSAPFLVRADGWQHKFFAGDVAQHLVHDENGEPVDDERSVMAKSSITVASLTARIVEQANFIKAMDSDKYSSARLQMQNSREDPGWSKATTRGSGVVMNEQGKELFACAIEQVAKRLAG